MHRSLCRPMPAAAHAAHTQIASSVAFPSSSAAAACLSLHLPSTLACIARPARLGVGAAQRLYSHRSAGPSPQQKKLQRYEYVRTDSKGGSRTGQAGGSAAASPHRAEARPVDRLSLLCCSLCSPSLPLQVQSLLNDARKVGGANALPSAFLPPSMRPRKERVAPQKEEPRVDLRTIPHASSDWNAKKWQKKEGGVTEKTSSTPAAAASPATATPAATSTPLPSSPNVSFRQSFDSVSEMSAALANELRIIQPTNPHASHIVVLGTPNSGKSTLVNLLVGQKISAVSHKKNTTRTSVLGVATKENRQLVLFDTPGVLPAHLSNKYQKDLSTAAWDSALGADLAIVIMDSVKRPGPAEFEMLAKAKEMAEQSDPPMELLLVLNKMDLCEPRTKAQALAKLVQPLAPFTKTYYVSLTKQKGTTHLEQYLYSTCLPREWEYAGDIRTDQSQAELVNEIVREKVFRAVHQEIPYRVSIENEGWTPLPDGSLRIDLGLTVQTRHQKRILRGAGDKQLRFLAQRSLPEIEDLLQRKVHLFLKAYSKD